MHGFGLKEVKFRETANNPMGFKNDERRSHSQFPPAFPLHFIHLQGEGLEVEDQNESGRFKPFFLLLAVLTRCQIPIGLCQLSDTRNQSSASLRFHKLMLEFKVDWRTYLGISIVR